MLYLGDKKAYEIYKGSTLIGQIYKGSTKVYDVNPYTKGKVIIEKSAGSYTGTLPRGVYKVALGGAKGNNISWAFEGAAWGASGGGGAFVEVIFFNPTARSITLKSGETGNSYLDLGGTRFLTANAGTNAAINNPGDGGTVSVNSGLDVLQTIKRQSGNNGSTAPYNIPSVATVSTYGNWGSTSNPSGGVRLEYIRYVR